MLPWFLLREIFNYAVYYNPKLCMANKEYFMLYAGQVMTIDSSNLKKNSQQSSWLKLAENLELDIYRGIDWVLLKNLKNLKTAFLKVKFEFGGDVGDLKTFLGESNINVLKLDISQGDGPNHYARELLEQVHSQLKKLEIHSKDMFLDFDRLLPMVYPEVEKLVLHNPVGKASFQLFFEKFPKVEHLEIHTNITVYSAINDNFIFLNLKKLIINSSRDLIKGTFKLTNIFKCHFPSLLTLSIDSIPYHKSIALMSNNMPKLQQFHVSMFFKTAINEVFFPTYTLNNLIDLDVKLITEKTRFNLDLAKLPSLLAINFQSQLNLINSNEYHQPLIKQVLFKNQSSFSSQPIFNQLEHLQRVEINCRFISNLYNEILKLCFKVDNMSLFNLEKPIPVSLMVPGPFKTTCLKLAGSDILNFELVQWLAQEFALTHLSLAFDDDDVYYALKPVVFPYLKELSISTWAEEDEAFARTVILCNPNHNFS